MFWKKLWKILWIFKKAVPLPKKENQ